MRGRYLFPKSAAEKWAVPWRDNRAAKSSKTAGGSKRRRYSAAMLPTRSRGTALDVAKGWAMPTSCAMCATCRHRFAEMFFKEFDRDSRFTLSISPQRRRRETAERRAERYAARDEVTAKAKTKRRRRLPGCCRSARQMAKRCRKQGRRRQCCPGCGRR